MAMTVFAYVGVFAALFVIGFASWVVGIYNALVAQRFEVDRAWGNIDVLLKQFHDEIPLLISVTQQYAQYERATIDHILQARERYGRATTTADKVAAAGAFAGAMQGICALGEAYPELRSNAQFVQLQARISAMQEHLSDRRELFNAVVTNYNARIRQVPDAFFAQFLGFGPLGLFPVTEAEKTTPNVELKLPA